jgi:very-short-patch-repair endonuclease
MSGASTDIRKARVLRRWMTAPDMRLWQALRNRQVAGLKFRRQSVVGPYVVGFLCPASSLIVEITGKGSDRHVLARRDAALRALGYRVLRLTRADVEDRMTAVLREIAQGAGHRS